MSETADETVVLQDSDKSRRVNAMFDRIAGRYDLMNTLMTGGLHHVWRARAIRLATANGARRILDVATGTGDFAVAAGRRPGVDLAVGIDFSAPMLRQAAVKARRRGAAGGKTRFATADALRLPFPGETFDAVTTGWGLRNFASVDAGLMEMVRVLRPGGRLVILEMTPRSRRGPLAGLIGLYTERVVPLLGAAAAGERDAYTYLPNSVHAFPGADELLARMTQAGLTGAHYLLAGFGTVAIHYGDKP